MQTQKERHPLIQKALDQYMQKSHLDYHFCKFPDEEFLQIMDRIIRESEIKYLNSCLQEKKNYMQYKDPQKECLKDNGFEV